MRKREVIESRKIIKKLKPILFPGEQAALLRSLIVRSEEFNRDRRTWRVLHSTTTKQERSYVLHENGTRGESVKGGSNRTEHRKSDEFVVVKKPGNTGGAKGLGWYRVASELLSQIRG